MPGGRPKTGNTRPSTAAASAARNAARDRLIALHRDEFDRLYLEEAVKVGVMPRNAKTLPNEVRIEILKKQIENLESQA